MPNLFTSLFGSIQKRFSPENPTLNPEGFPAKLFESHNGDIIVNDRVALQLSVIYSAIRIPAEDLASLTLGVYKKDKGFFEPVEHDLNYLFQVRASDLQTSFQWKESVTASVGARGNSFTLIHQRGGDVKSLEYLDDTLWECEVRESKSGKKSIVYFQKNSQGAKVNVTPASSIIHIPFTSFDGSAKSASPIEWLSNSIKFNVHSLNYGTSIMRNGMFGQGFLETEHELSDEAATRISSQLSRNYGGSDNAGKLAVLEGGLKYKPGRLSPADAEWVASRKFEVEDLLRPYRVPAHMIGHMESTSYNNVSEMALGYVKFCLYPWTKRWESELNAKLLSEQEYKSGLRIRFNLDDIMRGDVKQQSEYIQKMVTTGIMTRGEARDKLGLKAIEGTDELIIPQNIFGQPQQNEDSNSEEE